MVVTNWRNDQSIRMENMTWPDIKQALSRGMRTVVVGVGSTEQHGPHLPLQTDALIGDYLAFAVAEKLENALQARTISVGCSEHHLSFTGSISLRSETLKAIVHDYVSSLLGHGFEYIVFISSHGGNFAPLQEAVDALPFEQRQSVLTCSDLMVVESMLLGLSAQRGVAPEVAGAHAGESETSFMMVLAPEQVHVNRFEPGYVGQVGEAEIRRILQLGMTHLTRNGVLGDPRPASVESGRFYLDGFVELLCEWVKSNRGGSS